MTSTQLATPDHSVKPTPVSPTEMTFHYTDELAADSHRFTGTESWYRHPSGILLTDGVKWLAETLKCVWLIDQVAAASKLFWQQEYFITADFTTPQLGRGLLSLTDGNEKCLSNFVCQAVNLYVEPSARIRFFAIQDGYFQTHVLMLPSEY